MIGTCIGATIWINESSKAILLVGVMNDKIMQIYPLYTECV